MGQIVYLGHPPVPRKAEEHAKSEPAASKRALVLGGGGVVGAAFHTGALKALQEGVPGLPATGFDVYVGTSAGSFVCACLANGISPASLERARTDTAELGLPAIQSEDILKRVRQRYAAPVALAALRLLAGRIRGRRGMLLDSFFEVESRIPPWRPYTTSGLETYLDSLFSLQGRTNRFEELACELLITATVIASGERMILGPASGTSIAAAVAASSAIPGMFEPVVLGGRSMMDGGMGSVVNLDVALDSGAGLVVLINTLLPAPVEEPPRLGIGENVRRTFRIIAASQVRIELALAEARYPAVDVLVIQPGSNPLFHPPNLMDYRSWDATAAAAYEQVSNDLAGLDASAVRMLARHGLEVEPARVANLEGGDARR